MLDKLKMLIMGKEKSLNPVGSNTFMPPYGFANTLACYKAGSYDNTFPNISRIAETFMTIRPYCVNAKGDVVENANLLSALYYPNKEMSSVDFFEALMVMALVHPTVYILVWHREGDIAVPGGIITEKNIAGFTFLESPSVDYTDGHPVYRQGTQEYHEHEVITISLNVNPYSINAGYSPSLAAKKWANVDDYIVEYQSGFFQNGAVPAGQFIITAKDVDTFNKTVDKLQATHRGAGHNNNVVYVHRPVSAIDGKPMNAQVEWVPFSQSNKDMTLQALFDQANKKIDMDFGVPQEIKGYLQNSNYASVNVAERVFDKYVVLPKATKIWSKFTHELNRITGGLGYAISFDFHISALTDEEKTLAETRRIQLETLNSAIASGFTLETAIEALMLPEEFKTLAQASPEPRGEVLVEETTTTASQVETSRKSLSCTCGNHAKKKIDEPIDSELSKIIKDYTEKQINAAIEGEEFDKKKESKLFADAMLLVLLGIALTESEKQYDIAKNEVINNGGDGDLLTGYAQSEEFRNSYLEYLEGVALSYTDDTAAAVKYVLERGETENIPQEIIEEELRELIPNQEWRLRRLAGTEQHRAVQCGDLDAMMRVHNQTGLKIYKVWHVNPLTPNHCDVCLDLDGKKVLLDESFGDFPAGLAEVADNHPNCRCYLSFEFESFTPQIDAEQTSQYHIDFPEVKLCCPDCGRYMFNAKSCDVENVICANSKCKKHWNVKLVDGKATFEENK